MKICAKWIIAVVAAWDFSLNNRIHYIGKLRFTRELLSVYSVSILIRPIEICPPKGDRAAHAIAGLKEAGNGRSVD